MLIICHHDVQHAAGDLCGYGGDGAVDFGIIGRREAAIGQPIA
jgi:hypothetical protein